MAGLFGRGGAVFKLTTWQTRLTGARVWPVYCAFRAFLVGDRAGIGAAVSPREAWQDKLKDSARARTQGPVGVPLHVLAIPPSILFFWSNRGRYKTYAAREAKRTPLGRDTGKQNVLLTYVAWCIGLPRRALSPVYRPKSLLSRKKVDTSLIHRYT